MEVILLEKIAKLGELGDMVKVSAGYGRNYLLPQGKALLATEEHRMRFEQRRAEFEQRAQEALEAAKNRSEQLAKLDLVLAANASEEGVLYGSVGPREIADAVTAADITLERGEVQMPEGPFRTLGEYAVKAQLHTDVIGTIRVRVIAA